MSAPEIKLSTLVDVNGLEHSSFFPENIFELIGEPAVKWLYKLLDSKNTNDRFVHHCFCEIRGKPYFCGAVYVDMNAKIYPNAYIEGPCFIGQDAVIGHGACILGRVYVGPKAVVGHGAEITRSVLMEKAAVPHSAFIGDSLLGRGAIVGAGVRLANQRLDQADIKYTDPATGQRRSSGLNQLGALLGDRAQVGCNSVLSPGTILMPGAVVGPNEHFSGFKAK